MYRLAALFVEYLLLALNRGGPRRSQDANVSARVPRWRARVRTPRVVEVVDADETVEEIAYNYDMQPDDILRLRVYRAIAT